MKLLFWILNGCTLFEVINIKNNRIHQLHTPLSSDIQEANHVCIYDISNTFVIINYRCSLLKYTCVSSRKPTSSIYNRQDHVHCDVNSIKTNQY